MKRLLHGALRPRNSPTGEQIQNGRPVDELKRDAIPLDVAQHYSFIIAENSVRKIPSFSLTKYIS